jgi:hypothetical protein
VAHQLGENDGEVVKDCFEMANVRAAEIPRRISLVHIITQDPHLSDAICDALNGDSNPPIYVAGGTSSRAEEIDVEIKEIERESTGWTIELRIYANLRTPTGTRGLRVILFLDRQGDLAIQGARKF